MPHHSHNKIRYHGREYRSHFEVLVARQLEDLKIKFEFEAKKFSYTIPVKKRKYLADFSIPGTNILIEVKGHFTKADRDKALFVREANPDIDLRFLFQYDNTINRHSKTRYSDWCEKNGFLYAVGELPESWFKGS